MHQPAWLYIWSSVFLHLVVRSSRLQTDGQTTVSWNVLSAAQYWRCLLTGNNIQSIDQLLSLTSVSKVNDSNCCQKSTSQTFNCILINYCLLSGITCDNRNEPTTCLVLVSTCIIKLYKKITNWVFLYCSKWFFFGSKRNWPKTNWDKSKPFFIPQWFWVVY